jgi:rRNA biogenesis protein RRP5
VGGLLDVVVTSAADPRSVLVSAAPDDLAAAVVRGERPAAGGQGGAGERLGAAVSGLDALLPGALLNVRVRKVS